jgi:hypothetical protein
MLKSAKTTAISRAPVHRLSDSEILLFVSRTLQPQLDDAGTQTISAKLQSLRDILEQQDALLPNFSDSPGKDRMAEALAHAKDLLAQITDDLAGAAKKDSAANGQAGEMERR